jgi:hypothetical protein
MPGNPYVLENYADLLGELEYTKRTLAQARLGMTVASVAAQRAIEAIDHVEAAWGLFGRRRLPASRHALRRLLEGVPADPKECIEAVKELSALLLEREYENRPEDAHQDPMIQRHLAFASSGHAALDVRIGT